MFFFNLRYMIGMSLGIWSVRVVKLCISEFLQNISNILCPSIAGNTIKVKVWRNHVILTELCFVTKKYWYTYIKQYSIQSICSVTFTLPWSRNDNGSGREGESDKEPKRTREKENEFNVDVKARRVNPFIKRSRYHEQSEKQTIIALLLSYRTIR